MVKILGYIDNLLTWIIDWQFSLGKWNWLIIIIEMIVIFYGIFYLYASFKCWGHGG